MDTVLTPKKTLLDHLMKMKCLITNVTAGRPTLADLAIENKKEKDRLFLYLTLVRDLLV